MFGLSHAETGLIITVFALPGIVFAPIVGILTDRVGRQRVLVPCLLINGVGLAWIPLADSLVGSLAALLVFGLGHGLIVPSIATALADLGPGRFRGGVMSGRTSVLISGQAAGPMAFGLAAAAVGYPATLLAAGAGAGVIGAASGIALAWRARL